MIAALLALITAAIAAAPEIIKDIEQLLADAKKAQSGGDTNTAPLAPEVTADMAALEAKLLGK